MNRPPTEAELTAIERRLERLAERFALYVDFYSGWEFGGVEAWEVDDKRKPRPEEFFDDEVIARCLQDDVRTVIQLARRAVECRS